MSRLPHSRSRYATLAAASLLVALAACHHGGPGHVVPVEGYCGQRAAVALYRAPVSRRAASSGRGALVVRLTPADSGLVKPEGPVRVIPASTTRGDSAARVFPTTATGVTQTGPLPAGRYIVEATGTGYRPSRLTVAVRAGATDTVRFRLAAMCVRRAGR